MPNPVSAMDPNPAVDLLLHITLGQEFDPDGEVHGYLISIDRDDGTEISIWIEDGHIAYAVDATIQKIRAMVQQAFSAVEG